MLTACSVALLAVGWYAVLCAVKPFTTCRRCRGTGAVERFGKPRTCPRCHGRRFRLRAGRRAHNAWRHTRDAGTS
jgi:Zn finger protein HypA/HybF involved in hydrogenase expression